MKKLLLCLLLTGCANTPTRYNEFVYITEGTYRGYLGRLIGDCSGLENYKVRLDDGRKVCIRIWQMEQAYR